VINGHRVLIADDHQPLRRGVRTVLERGGFRVVAECDDGPAAVAAADRLRPEICLLDVQMPGGGVEAAAEIHRLLPAIGIVMLTVSADSDTLFAALRAGARGYLLKDMDPARLPQALSGVLKGEAAIPRELVLRIIDEFGGRQEQGVSARDSSLVGLGLTPREWDVLDLLAAGHSTSQIASHLTITGVTVRSHIATIMRKLDVPDRGAAVRMVRDAYRPGSDADEPFAGVEDLNGFR
jgi:DNA-binding NarL/FixJ family response regulator